MEKVTKMRKVCAWCEKDKGEIEGEGQTGTTHGICKDCLKKELVKLRKYLRTRKGVSLNAQDY